VSDLSPKDRCTEWANRYQIGMHVAGVNAGFVLTHRRRFVIDPPPPFHLAGSGLAGARWA
jgi:hypothetical protein